MDENKKMDTTDKYMLTLIGLIYLYMYGKNIIISAADVSGWDWLFFVILAVIALFFYSCGFAMSYGIAAGAISYFGLPKNYLVATLLAIVIAPLTVIILSLLLSGFIPSLFDPRFL